MSITHSFIHDTHSSEMYVFCIYRGLLMTFTCLYNKKERAGKMNGEKKLQKSNAIKCRIHFHTLTDTLNGIFGAMENEHACFSHNSNLMQAVHFHPTTFK